MVAAIIVIRRTVVTDGSLSALVSSYFGMKQVRFVRIVVFFLSKREGNVHRVEYPQLNSSFHGYVLPCLVHLSPI